MDHRILVPVALFASIVYALRLLIEARLKYQLFKVEPRPELVAQLFRADELQRRERALQWGLVLIALAIALVVIEVANWRQLTPGVGALLLLATGVANLGFYAFTGRRAPRGSVDNPGVNS